MRNLTVVLKLSKLCNLRCGYCYEFADLGNKARMPLEGLAHAFPMLRDVADRLDADIKFCWHGGEPLLLGRDYIDAAMSHQRRTFPGGVNSVIQTNLFKVGTRELDVLRMFDHVSVSFDPFSDEREDAAGRSSRTRVADNMGFLRENNIRFGAISVLSAESIVHVERTFEFFNAARLSFRALPYYREADATRTARYGVPMRRIRDAMVRLVDLWFERSTGIEIFPIADYVSIAALHLTRRGRAYRYEKAKREHVFVVDTDGAIYTSGTAYDRRYVYGNAFRRYCTNASWPPRRRDAAFRSKRSTRG